LGDVQQLIEENFAAVSVSEWDAVCGHVTPVEEVFMSDEHEMDSVMERVIINVDDDYNETSVSLVTTTMMTYNEPVHSLVTATNIRNN
jgi:hypothetical protein